MSNAMPTASRTPSDDVTDSSTREHVPTLPRSTTPSDALPTAGTSQLKPRATETRARVVPKKSKLSLLAGKAGAAVKSRENDLSDVVRRVGASSSASTGRGFEIYVDPANDPDDGDIVVVKKKKSRATLGNIGWSSSNTSSNAPLKDGTNVSAPVEKSEKPGHFRKASTGALSLLTGKRSMGPSDVPVSESEDGQKWWTLGRNRRDSKHRSKDSKDFRLSSESRSRFGSLNSGILLSDSGSDLPQELRGLTETTDTSRLTFAPPPQREAPPPLATMFMRSSSPGPTSALETPSDADTPASASASADEHGKSIALRAMRSMRSMATISGWSIKGGDKDNGGSIRGKKEGKNEKKDKAEGKKREKERRSEDTDRSTTSRSVSRSSYEPTTASESEAPAKTERKSLEKKKSVLSMGLGWPATLRSKESLVPSSPSVTSPPRSSMPPSVFETRRYSVDFSKRLSTGSDGLSVSSKRLSSGSVNSIDANLTATLGRARAGSRSTMSSSNSSLRPLSTFSGTSGGSSGSSAAGSVRWDEDGLATVREQRVAERAARSESRAGSSRRSSNEKRRPGLASIFSGSIGSLREKGKAQELSSDSEVEDPTCMPLLQPQASLAGEQTIKQPLADPDETISTPLKVRRRPVSDQLPGRARPRGMTNDSEGVLSILDAATNELASLINRLDLEATPCTPDDPSFRPSPSILVTGTSEKVGEGSPSKVKSTLLGKRAEAHREPSSTSIASLRSYAQLRSKMAQVSTASSTTSQAHLIGQHIVPPAELGNLVSPDKLEVPSTAKPFSRPTHKRSFTVGHEPEPLVFQPLRPPKPRSSSPSEVQQTPLPAGPPSRPHSGSTFGRQSGRVFKRPTETSDADASPSPIFRKPGQPGERTSLSVFDAAPSQYAIPLSSSVRNSHGSIATDRIFQAKNEDAELDVADGFHRLVSRTSRDTLRSANDAASSLHEAGRPPSPGLPPAGPLPAPVASTSPVLPNLPELPSLGSLFHSDKSNDELCHQDDAPAPPSPTSSTSSEGDVDYTKKSFEFTAELRRLTGNTANRRSFVEELENAFQTSVQIDLQNSFGDYLSVDVPPMPEIPSHLLPDEEVSIADSNDDLSYVDEEVISIPIVPRAADGQLNRNFKFGGKMPSPAPIKNGRSMTLSDIIPPPNEARALSMAFSSADNVTISSFSSDSMYSISEAQPAIVVSDSSEEDEFTTALNEAAQNIDPRRFSIMSFAGFDSFEEVRRGFEFGADRPAFYPAAGGPRDYGRGMSLYSSASDLDYGDLVHSGMSDPFGFNRESGSRPVSIMTMSDTVDDTFAFAKQGIQRRRVDSDASDSYFPPKQGLRMSQIYSLPNYQSTTSLASMGAPASLYNRAYDHRPPSFAIDSASSVALSYALHGAIGGRASWRGHFASSSRESIMSDFSAARLGRPGLGDKMLDSGSEDYSANFGMPFDEVAESQSINEYNGQPFDAFMHETYEDNIPAPRQAHRESIFGSSLDYPSRMRPYRPVSILSLGDEPPQPQDDDTMVSMIGGGYVRRQSMSSVFDGSPCARIGARKLNTMQGVLLAERFAEMLERDKGGNSEDQPGNETEHEVEHEQEDEQGTDTEQDHAQLLFHRNRALERLSFQSTASSQFGDFGPPTERINKRLSTISTSSSNHGDERMLHMRQDFLHDQSLDTCTSSDMETPALSAAEDTSMSSNSQYSIDISHLNLIFGSMSNSSSAFSTVRARARSRGQRRRIEQARMSRSSVYETIEEETPSPGPASHLPTIVSPLKITIPQVGGPRIADSDMDSIRSSGDWSNLHGESLRQFYKLKDEALSAVEESKRMWADTPISLFATQSFEPPSHPEGMREMLDNSKRTFTALPSELRVRRMRSRTSSRTSPYPVRSIVGSRNGSMVSLVPASMQMHSSPSGISESPLPLPVKAILQQAQRNTSAPLEPSPLKSFFSNLKPKAEGTVRASKLIPKRSSLVLGKRQPKSNEQKENTQGNGPSYADQTLRVSRPRPRGRPTLSQKPIRV